MAARSADSHHSAARADSLTVEINNPEVVAEVSALFKRYQDAILSNDTALLNELFWKSPLTIRYGSAENLYGHDAIAAFRAGIAPGQHARVVMKEIVTTYGRDFATTNCEYTRGQHKGRQTQMWARLPEGWRIVSAHVSYMVE